MSNPKRNHWWPELQTRHWKNPSGFLYVTKADGTYFQTSPENIGVEGHLYARQTIGAEKDVTIEKWFASDIEGPFRESLDWVVTLPGLCREPFQLDQDKSTQGKALGFVVNDYRETIDLPAKHRVALALYLAALVVRSPRYLKKIQEFHATQGNGKIDAAVRTASLNNMLQLFDVYKESIASSTIMFTKREGDSEFLFSDAGITPEEPWRPGPIPFDIFAPLTPDLAVTVLPSPAGDFRHNRRCILGRARPQGVARLNRIIIGGAERFVFSRSFPPVGFIKENFGKPAPKSIGVRWKDGRVEVQHDRSKDN